MFVAMRSSMVQMSMSASSAEGEWGFPVRVIVVMPPFLAARSASRMLGLLPLVDSAIKTSPGRPCASTPREKTLSKPKSFPTQVRCVGSLIEIAERASRFFRNRPANSSATCIESDIEPPFPHVSTRPRSRKQAAIIEAARPTEETDSSRAMKFVNRSRACDNPSTTAAIRSASCI